MCEQCVYVAVSVLEYGGGGGPGILLAIRSDETPTLHFTRETLQTSISMFSQTTKASMQPETVQSVLTQ